MTSFIQPGFSKRHAGVERLEAAVDSAKDVSRSFDGTKGLSAMLLAAMVAALVVVADQLIDTWADGHLMAAWVALWVVAFAAVAVFAGSARQLAVTTMNSLDAWSAKLAKQRADRRMWTVAQSDPRLMAELTAAIERSQSE
jgi:hypothetical protein